VRPVTRNTILAIFVVIALLLALGSLPSLLQSGDPYYVTAEATGTEGVAVNATNLSVQQYPYILGAVTESRSDAYFKGPFGFKEGFSHSPFDEFSAISQRYADAAVADGEAVYVVQNGTRYRVKIVQEVNE
jgi:hypothetical protein